MKNKECLHIILNQFKKEYLTDEEAITLIESMFNKDYIYYYPYSPTITPYYTDYNTTPNKDFTVTCNDNK